ncbi:Mob1/phocein [Artemisia annua]|uniref:Mob1/phocein n=1 Tax=Artemisia annua TaxID=35608 RepID=A0A2U1PCE4_ARTAN|nr:Mob1/phocein [Artemisia annua]
MIVALFKPNRMPYYLNPVTVDFFNQVNLLYGTLTEFCTPEICPTMTAGVPFPANFRDVVKTIFKRLFRVYAHIYHTHFQKIVSLKEEAHLNTCFKHFILLTCVNLLYGTLTEFCTPEICPTMTAGPKYEYRWADCVQIKKPIEVSPPKYVEFLMDWIES